MVKENLGCKTILGVSNISFGTPNRRVLNNTYLNLALGAGLDLAIINTEDKNMVNSVYAYRVISNIDKGCVDYIKKCSNISADWIICGKNNSPLSYFSPTLSKAGINISSKT